MIFFGFFLRFDDFSMVGYIAVTMGVPFSVPYSVFVHPLILAVIDFAKFFFQIYRTKKKFEPLKVLHN